MKVLNSWLATYAPIFRHWGLVLSCQQHMFDLFGTCLWWLSQHSHQYKSTPWRFLMRKRRRICGPSPRETSPGTPSDFCQHLPTTSQHRFNFPGHWSRFWVPKADLSLFVANYSYGRILAHGNTWDSEKESWSHLIPLISAQEYSEIMSAFRREELWGAAWQFHMPCEQQSVHASLSAYIRGSSMYIL